MAVKEQIEKPKQIHLPFLDGIRGLAALYVALFHNVSATTSFIALSAIPLVHYTTSWLKYGHYAVDVFIVLSGYCLTLPIAGMAAPKLRKGILEFVKRRALRILPAYYASLVVSIILLLAARHLHMQARADEAVTFTAGNLLSHLFLLHNASYAWNSKINVVLWTIATEWQIYFIFALLLLPVWRKLGNIGLLIIAFALGMAPHFLLPAGFNLDWARPWYIGLFAMGMLGARVTCLCDTHGIRLSNKPLLLITALCITIVCAVELHYHDTMQGLWIKDPFVGLAAIALILICVYERQHGIKRISFFLESKLVAALGLFSYSLYLIHIPAMWTLRLVFHFVHLTPMGELGFRLLFGMPYIILCAYLFYRVFEKPFMDYRKRDKNPRSINVAGLIKEEPAYL